MLKVAALVGVGSGTVSGQEGDGWPDGDGGVTVVETVGKDNGADRLRIAVRAMDPSPTTRAVPFTPGCHRS